tara:strand:- start:13025 stop:13495 length:471 start_codon:yes stop_codon:yes gene_type:complete
MVQQPSQTPKFDPTSENALRELYAGFWIRLGASTIDSILLLLLITPLLIGTYGIDPILTGKAGTGLLEFLITWIIPAVVIIAFWVFRSATPGKMLLRIKIIDAKTRGKPSIGQLIWRYLAYIVSTIPLMLGFLWVAFDERKQGWHDKLARTIVVQT